MLGPPPSGRVILPGINVQREDIVFAKPDALGCAEEIGLSAVCLPPPRGPKRHQGQAGGHLLHIRAAPLAECNRPKGGYVKSPWAQQPCPLRN